MPDIFVDQKPEKPPIPIPHPKRIEGGMHLNPVGGMLPMFLVKPKNITFETQDADEEIILFLRQHYIVNLGWIFASIILFLVPLILGPLLLSSNILPNTLPGGYFIVLPLFWYVGLFGYMLANFLHWYFNVYIVTNERIVDIDWINLLYKQFSTVQLNKVQDVTYKQGGFLDLFFNFGHVFIQTAGTEQNFEFKSVPHADMVVRQIDDLLETVQGK